MLINLITANYCSTFNWLHTTADKMLVFCTKHGNHYNDYIPYLLVYKEIIMIYNPHHWFIINCNTTEVCALTLPHPDYFIELYVLLFILFLINCVLSCIFKVSMTFWEAIFGWFQPRTGRKFRSDMSGLILNILKIN